MTLGAYIVALLRAWPAVTTLAGSRIHPVKGPDNPGAPLLIYTVVAGADYPTHDDADTPPSTDLQRTTVQLSAYARTLAEASALSAAAHNALHLAQDGIMRVNLAAGPVQTLEADLYHVRRDLTLFHHLTV